MASWVCVDCSFVVRLLVDHASSPAAARLWREWLDQGLVVAAPALLYYEVVNALHRYLRGGYLTDEEASAALEVGLSLGLVLHGELDLHRQAARLAGELGLPAAYNAHYLALAVQLAAPLWTADGRLFRKVRQDLPWVKLLPVAIARQEPEGGG